MSKGRSVGEVVEALPEALSVELLVDAVAGAGGVGEGRSGRLGGVERALVAGRRGIDLLLGGAEGFVVAAMSPRAGLVGLALEVPEISCCGGESVTGVTDGLFEGCGSLVGGGDGLVGHGELFLER